MKRFFAGVWNVILQVWGMFCGADKMLSFRRIAGAAFLVAGLQELVKVSLRPWPDEITPWVLAYALGPGGVLVIVGALFWNWISVQNLQAVAEGLRK